MYNLITLIKSVLFGFITGISISIPLGPSAIESINRTLSIGFKDGFLVSLGAIIADLTYLILMNCGLSNLFKLNKKCEGLFWIISGVILLILSFKYMFYSKNTSNATGDKSKKHSRKFPFLSGYILTLCNPMTPALWLGMSGTILMSWKNLGYVYYYTFIISIFIAMIGWFTTLNLFALKGKKIAKSNTSNKLSRIIDFILLFIGIIFIVLGFIKLSKF